MERDENSDDTAQHTSSSDIEEEIRHSVGENNADVDSTRMSEQLGDSKRVLKQPLLSHNMDTTINLPVSPAGSGSDPSTNGKEHSSALDSSGGSKYPIKDYPKRKVAEYVVRAFSTARATCLNGPRDLTLWIRIGVDFSYSSMRSCAASVR